jgi:hypothetical protein
MIPTIYLALLEELGLFFPMAHIRFFDMSIRLKFLRDSMKRENKLHRFQLDY